MIGDIIGVTHEELGLVYAKVEYINETGDLMVRADNDYMNGGYECTVKDCQPIEFERMSVIDDRDNGFVINRTINLFCDLTKFHWEVQRGVKAIRFYNDIGDSINVFVPIYVHQLQHAIRILGVDDKARIVIR